MPDLVGPVGLQFFFLSKSKLRSCLPRMLSQRPRVHPGCIIALRSGYGCERRPEMRSSRNQLLIVIWDAGTRPWITLTASKHGEQHNPAG